MYLVQMGMAATFDQKVFCKQALIGRNYGLLSAKTFIPNPDYYGELLWHRLMGSTVLAVTKESDPDLRVYSHCAKKKPGVSVIFINLLKDRSFNITLSNLKSEDDGKPNYEFVGKQNREEYHLTSLFGKMKGGIVCFNDVPMVQPELLKDFGCENEYHPGKANVVADALSRNAISDLRALFAQMSLYEDGSLLAELRVIPTLISKIRAEQPSDPFLMHRMKDVEEGASQDFSFDRDGVLCFRGRYCIPMKSGLNQIILREAHDIPYSMHPGRYKMYKNLQERYWWKGLKRDVVDFVSKCLTCQKVKAEYQRPSGLFQHIEIPQWKWEQLTMDIVTGHPLTPSKRTLSGLLLIV
ncbi:hypothetical protein GQ457_01G017220 [Hibiscus cannabinus]